jgi:hypothetical protein
MFDVRRRCVFVIGLSFLTLRCPAADNLVANGDFEQADPAAAGRPLGWDRPDGLGIQWVEAPASQGGVARGKAIRFDTAVSEQAMMDQWKKVGITDWNIPAASAGPVGATYGLSFYSKAFPIAAGKTYRVTVAHRGTGGGKVWVRGYGEKNGKPTRMYEAVAECLPSESWQTIEHVFNPTQHRPAVTEMRVMLYAYWPAGVSWFDAVRVEEIPEPAAIGK